ncbi:hypothetical protein IJ076_00555 [Candidatus Saccharibacteria bacterium]|nr:hypothetical protein [Candidatus Saccharibacteria bacterium]
MRRNKYARPMPTEEDKEKAKLKAAGADPLVWAMKSVDEEFPDDREKDAETIQAETEVVEPEDDTEEMLDDEGDVETPVNEKATEIRAEDKTAMPMDDGVMTVEVTPMRQDVSKVSPDEAKQPIKAEANDTLTTDKDGEMQKKVIFSKKNSSKAEKTDDPKVQVKLTSLESKQKKMMFAFAALILLAIGGVAFGVVAMVQQNKTVENLENQIASVTTTTDEVDDEYITLKDWGLKIKIISGLSNVNYNYVDDDSAEVLIWGSTKSTENRYVPDFAKQNKNSNPLGTVVRVPRYERAAAGRLIWYDDYYNYYYQGPTGVPEVSEDEMSWWVESYLLIKDMLTNADNYSSISEATVGQQ